MALPSPASRSSRRFTRAILILIGVMLAAVVLTFVFASQLAHHYSVSVLQNQLGRHVSIENLDLNFFPLRIDIKGVKIDEADGHEGAFSLGRIVAVVDLSALLKKNLVVNELTVEAPELRLVNLGDGKNNWSDVFSKLRTNSPKKDARVSYSVANIKLTNGRVLIDDREKAQKHAVENLTLTLPFLSNMPVTQSSEMIPSLSAEVDGKALSLSGTSKQSGDVLQATLNVRLRDFDLAPWMAYVPLGETTELRAGTLDTDLTVAFQQDGRAPLITLSGETRISNIALLEKNRHIASIAQLEVAFSDSQPLIQKWQLARLYITQPKISVERNADGSIRLPEIVNLPDRASAPPKTRSVALPTLDIKTGHIRGGQIDFIDRTFSKPFQTNLSIDLELKDFLLADTAQTLVTLEIGSTAGEKIQFAGQIGLTPVPMLNGTIDLQQIQPVRYVSYFNDILSGADLRGGRLSARATVAASFSQNLPDIALSIEQLDLSSLGIALKGQKNPAIQVPILNMRDSRISLKDQHAQIGSIAVWNANVTTIRHKNGTFDLQTLAPATKNEKSTAQWSYAIDKVFVSNATAQVQDLSSGLRITTDQATFNATAISSEKNAKAPFSASVRINSIARLGVTGTITLNPPRVDIHLDQANTDLSRIRGPLLDAVGSILSYSDGTLKDKLKTLSPDDILKDAPEKAKEALREGVTERLQDLLRKKR